MKNIITYNLNGIRSVLRKGFSKWLEIENPDILCIQETKAQESQIEKIIFENLGYHQYWFSAKKKGYSGVGILTKQKADKVFYGVNNSKFDDEGRFIMADFKDFSVISVYHPSGSSGDLRQNFKMEHLSYFQNFIRNLKKERPNLIISGDYNIAHKEIDIHNPKRLKKTSGFLPEERLWFSNFLENEKFIDSFRFLNKERNIYSWWSYRGKAREKNLGWRIDYNLVSENLKDKIIESKILKNIVFSDHSPVFLKIDF